MTVTPSIQRIKASDGTANANLATVQSTRSPGATTLVVDTVVGINPTSFEGSMGAPHTFTDPVTSETITVISEASCVDFTGHVNGINLVIDTIAPGYTDTRGSVIGDIVVIRPTTDWANNVAAVLGTSHNDDGTLKTNVVISTNAATLTTPIIKTWDGYITASNTWVYASATSFTIAGTDVTAQFPIGTKIKLTQTTVKYFYVTSSSFSTNTTVNITGGTDFTLANAAITSPFYSYEANPQGFPGWFNFNAAPGGFSAIPTIISRFTVSGRKCTVSIYPTGNGTSNATTHTYVAPIASANVTGMLWTGRNMHVDNSVTSNSEGTETIGPNTTTITVYQNSNSQGWTNSGTKAATFSLDYEI